MESIRITRHGAKRTKERLGLSKRIADKNAQSAYLYGVTHAETNGKLKEYLDYIGATSKIQLSAIRVYNRYVYIFAEENGISTMITVWELPQCYRKRADDLQARKKASFAKAVA